MIIRGLDYLRPSGISKSVSESLETQYKDKRFFCHHALIQVQHIYIYIYTYNYDIDEYNILYHITFTYMTSYRYII